MATSTSRLETLPTTVLDFICETLAHCDSRRRSLFAFSLVSKHCCAVADRQRFERIPIKVRGSSELREDVERWTSLLEKKGRFRHVRRVKVIGFMPPDSPHDDQTWVQSLKQAVEESAAHDREERTGEGCGHDDFLDPPERPVLIGVAGSHLDSPEADKLHDEAWQPFAEFIAKLPGLKDLVYSCADQVPPCLLAALHQYHPQSRLHVHTFALRSLFQRKTELHDIDLHEYALITSPCLYSVLLNTPSQYLLTGIVNYNYEALLVMASGVSPGLRHVRAHVVVLNRWHTFQELREAIKTPRPNWRGFFEDKNAPRPSKGQLECLSISENLDLMAWTHITDFQKLRSLEFYHCESRREPERFTGNMDTLSRVASRLSNIQIIILIIRTFPDEYLRRLASLAELLERLPPLEELSITAFYDAEVLSAITQRHGASLRKLKLVPLDTTTTSLFVSRVGPGNLISELQQHCPNLRELTLVLLRSNGDEREVALYRALGTFKFLTHVSIMFGYRDALQWYALSFQSVVRRQLLPEKVRDVFINVTFDAALARSIFNVISQENPSLRVMRSSVHLDVYRSEVSDSFAPVLVAWLGRSWLCQKYPRHDQTGEVTVEEIRPSYRYKTAACSFTKFETCGGRLLFEKVWSELWPEKTNVMLDDGTSFPLVDDTD